MNKVSLNKVEIYCDGSATTMDKPGGFAYVVVVDGEERYRENGSLIKATNNVAEVTAAIRGLEYVSKDPVLAACGDITLISDSQLVLGYADGRYQCKTWHLVPLYIELRKIFGQLNAKTRWVRGHSGDQFNEVCDQLAKAARSAVKDK